MKPITARVMGGFDLPRALATLAYEGRRRDLFAERIPSLPLQDDRSRRAALENWVTGSWAGRDQWRPQFLPSIYLRFARDGDGDGKADIWTSEADTLASIGAYFANAGWRPGQPWGLAVGAIPVSFWIGQP